MLVKRPATTHRLFREDQMPNEKTYLLGDEARAEWERVWGRRYTTDYAPWEQRCAKMILDMDDAIRALQAENKRLTDELADLQEMFSTTQQQDTESTLRVGVLLDENKLLKGALEKIAGGHVNPPDEVLKNHGTLAEFMWTFSQKYAKAAIAETQKCPSCSDTGRVIIGPGDMTDPCECPIGQAKAETEGE